MQFNSEQQVFLSAKGKVHMLSQRSWEMTNQPIKGFTQISHIPDSVTVVIPETPPDKASEDFY